MSRGLSATNTTEIAKASVQVVLLVKLDFDTPIYTHSGVGDITYDGNTYSGVGDFGGISEARESEFLGPAPITLTLSGIDSTLIAEALEAGRYKDDVTIYEGYRKDDGTLKANPWTVWSGWFEYPNIKIGDDNTISVVCQHDLSLLNEKDGGRFTDEDQVERYSGDEFFEHITDQATVKLNWGGGRINSDGVFPGDSRRGGEREAP